jgi:hypothetical protein
VPLLGLTAQLTFLMVQTPRLRMINEANWAGHVGASPEPVIHVGRTAQFRGHVFGRREDKYSEPG